MTSKPLQRWLESGALRRHRPTRREINDLLAVVDRDYADAQVTAVSLDRRFATAYSSALQLATVVLTAEGYRASAQRGHHVVTIRALPELLGDEFRETAHYLDSCRALRNTSDYDRVGAISKNDVAELLDEVSRLRDLVVDWLGSKHPSLAFD